MSILINAVAAGVPNVSTILLAQSAIPFVIAPTGTMANNGAITMGTALPTIYTSSYVYLPLNAIQAGSAAGWYYTVMSSTTLGTVYNNTYTSGIPSIPASPTAFVSTGPGAYTGVTGATQAQNISLPANTLGPFGMLRVSQLWSANAANTNRALLFRIGATNLTGITLTTNSQPAWVNITNLYNRGAQNINVAPTNGATIGAPAAANVFTTFDFSTAQTLSFYINMSTATDYITQEGFLIEVMP